LSEFFIQTIRFSHLNNGAAIRNHYTILTIINAVLCLIEEKSKKISFFLSAVYMHFFSLAVNYDSKPAL